MKNAYDAVKHLKWKFIDLEDSKASIKDKKALKLIISHLRDENKKVVYDNQIVLKMYLSLVKIALSHYKSINFASKRVHYMLDRDLSDLTSELKDSLNLIYYNDFCEKNDLLNERGEENLEEIKKYEKAYLQHVDGVWTNEEVFSSLSQQFLLMINTFMK